MFKEEIVSIILKDLKEDRRELISLIISEAVLISLFTVGSLGFQLFSSKDADEYFMREDGISRLFVSACSLILLCGIVLLIATLIPYLGKRVPKYILLQRMGISLKDNRLVIIIEAGVTYLLSILPGLLLGILFTSLLKHIILSHLGINFELGTVSVFTYPIICVVTLGTYALSFLLTGELESDFRVITSTQESARTERLKNSMPAIWTSVGCILCVLSCFSFCRIEYHEALYLTAVFYFGMYLVVKNLASVHMMNIHKNKPDKYYRNLLFNNQFYNRFQTTSRYILALSLISFLGCFYSGFQIIGIINAQQPEDLFPYDIMCLADENDVAYFENLKKNSDIELYEYPMIRIANLDKTERFERISDITIQGQQIGISESTYHKLKKKIDPSYIPKDLGLDDDGNNVYIIHQQDSSVKAQPVDWRYNKSKPDLHVGVPCIRVLDEYHGTYYEKEVAGEEITSITGCYSTPKCENIIVFSDSYFHKAQDEWMNVDVATGYSVEAFKAFLGDDAEPLLIQGPTRLILINANTSHIKKIDKELNAMEEDHKYIGNIDPSVHFHYSTLDEIEQIKVERAARIAVSICMMIILLIMEALLLYSKCQMELKEKKDRDRILCGLGMLQRARMKIISREINALFLFPNIFLVISSILFLGGTYSVRMYNSKLVFECTRMYVTLIAVWIVINYIFTWVIKVLIGKEVLSDE